MIFTGLFSENGQNVSGQKIVMVGKRNSAEPNFFCSFEEMDRRRRSIRIVGVNLQIRKYFGSQGFRRYIPLGHRRNIAKYAARSK